MPSYSMQKDGDLRIEDGGVPLFKLETDDPTVLIAVALHGRDDCEPAGVTIVGIGKDYQALRKAVNSRFKPAEHGAFECMETGRYLGNMVGSYVIEVPLDAPRMDLLIGRELEMMAMTRKAESEDEPAGPRM